MLIIPPANWYFFLIFFKNEQISVYLRANNYFIAQNINS